MRVLRRWPAVLAALVPCLLALLVTMPTAASAADFRIQATQTSPTTFQGFVRNPAQAGTVVTLYERPYVPGEVYSTLPWVAVTSTVTAADGSFSFGTLEADSFTGFTLSFKSPSPDWGLTWWSSELGGGAPLVPWAFEARAGYYAPISVNLVGPCTVHGTVRGRGGLAPGEGMSFFLCKDDKSGMYAPVNSDGTYTLAGVFAGTYTAYVQEALWGPPNNYFTTWAPAASDASSAEVFTLSDGDSLKLDVQMNAATTFSGTLVCPNGAPAAHVFTTLFKWDGSTSSWGSLGQFQTDANGQWHCGGQTGGLYKIEYRSGWELPDDVVTSFYQGASTLDSATVITAQTGDVVSVDDTAAVGGEIHVHCRDGNGALQNPCWSAIFQWNAAAGAWQELETKGYGYAADYYALLPGRYRVEALPGGDDGWGAHVRATFYPDATSVVDATDVVVGTGTSTSVEVKIWPAEAISGSVASSLSSVGRREAVLSLWRRSDDGTWTVCATQSNDFFDFEGLDPGTYRVTAHDPTGAFLDTSYPAGTGLHDAADIVVARGARINNIALKMRPIFGAISGVVREFGTQNPVPGARVTINAEEYSSVFPDVSSLVATADAQGRYTILYEAALVQAMAFDPSGAHSPLQPPFMATAVTIVPGVVTPLDVWLEPREPWTGTVVDAVTGAPLSGIIVSQSDTALPGGDVRSDVTGADGTFSVLSDIGDLELTATDPTGRYSPGWASGQVRLSGVTSSTIPMTLNPSAPGIGPDTATTLTVPSSQTGTLFSDPTTDGAGPSYWYSVHLSAGQTLEATITADPRVGDPSLFAFGPWGIDLSSDPVSSAVQRLFVMAPATGDYFVVAGGDTVGTFTVEAAIVPPRLYSLSAVTAPKTAKRNRSFSVSVMLRPDYDGLRLPITFYVQRKSGRTWKTYKTVTGSMAAGGSATQTPFKTSLKLPAGAFRVRAAFRDAAHPSAKYTGWKSITVR